MTGCVILSDKRKVKAMLPRCYLQREVPKWRYNFILLSNVNASIYLWSGSQDIHMTVLHALRFELELLLHKGVKFEIEALSVHSVTFLSHEYLPSKIHNGGYI